MRILELERYAQDNDCSDSLRFKFKDLNGNERTGQWIDAYFGFFKLDNTEEDKFLTVSQWRKLFGDDMIDFEIIEDE